MNDKKFQTFLAMTEIDDGFVAESARLKRRPRFLPWACAAAVLIIAVLLIIRTVKKPDKRSVYAEPTGTPASTVPAVPEPTADPSPTAFITEGVKATSGPSFTPEATAAVTETVSDSPYHTPYYTPYETPYASPPVTPSPAPVITEAPSPEPTPSITPPMPTPVPPCPSSEPPEPTGVPTMPPEPTQAPTNEPLPEQLVFYSENDFTLAVRNHASPLLEGLETYYVPETVFSGMSLKRIVVRADTVTLSYDSSDGRNWIFAWFRIYGGDHLSVIASQYPGEWHGGHYVLDHSESEAMMGVYWAQHGALFMASIPSSTGDRPMFAFCSAAIRTAA